MKVALGHKQNIPSYGSGVNGFRDNDVRVYIGSIYSITFRNAKRL